MIHLPQPPKVLGLQCEPPCPADISLLSMVVLHLGISTVSLPFEMHLLGNHWLASVTQWKEGGKSLVVIAETMLVPERQQLVKQMTPEPRHLKTGAFGLLA